MGSVSKLSNVSKVSKVLSKMTKVLSKMSQVSRCYTSNSSEIRVSQVT